MSMPRSTDPAPRPQGPLGDRVAPKPAKPAASDWEPVPGSPGIERNRVTGRMRTNFKNVYDNAKG